MIRVIRINMRISPGGERKAVGPRNHVSDEGASKLSVGLMQNAALVDLSPGAAVVGGFIITNEENYITMISFSRLRLRENLKQSLVNV